MKLTFTKSTNKHAGTIWYKPACPLTALLFLDIGSRKGLKQSELKKLEALGFVIERKEDEN